MPHTSHWESLLKIQLVMGVMIGIVLPLLAAGARAAELKVYASTAVKAVLEELGPQFEKATGDKLVFTFGLSSAVKKQIDEGAAFDVAVLTPALIDGLAAAGKIDPASRVAIARAGSGVAVSAGSPKPDVSTAEALKRTLLQAKSIGLHRRRRQPRRQRSPIGQAWHRRSSEAEDQAAERVRSGRGCQGRG